MKEPQEVSFPSLPPQSAAHVSVNAGWRSAGETGRRNKMRLWSDRDRGVPACRSCGVRAFMHALAYTALAPEGFGASVPSLHMFAILQIRKCTGWRHLAVAVLSHSVC